MTVSLQTVLSASSPVSRKNNGKFTACSQLTLDDQLGLMSVDYVLDNGQPQAGPASLPRPVGADPEKALGQPRDIPVRNTDAGVPHFQSRPSLAVCPGDPDATTLRCVLDCVPDQIAERAFEVGRYAGQLNIIDSES